ncbi:MAG TPA: DUF1684 domain-containing protein [Gemmatimonadales bacterium]|nr:DUF1684 domain-containing protein [Gemmatimonadales bacterium]
MTRKTEGSFGLGVMLLLLAANLAAQVPPDLAAERAGYLAWLKTAPNSPLSAVAQQRVGEGVRLGPAEADIPLAGIEEYRVYPSGGGLVLEGPGGKRAIGRGRPYRIGKYALYLTGPQPGTVLTVFADGAGKEPPGYYDYDASLVFVGPLLRLKSPQQVRVLASDGMEVEATEVGTVVVPLGGRTSLRVFRIPVAGGDESELEIFFQDGTNGDGSYPAGRFVSLIPGADGKFRLDLNRARNPFCAYSPVYACPLPWGDNVIAEPVRAGERYSGGGLENPSARENAK